MISEWLAIAIAIFISIPLVVVGTDSLIALFSNTQSPYHPNLAEQTVSYKVSDRNYNSTLYITPKFLYFAAMLADVWWRYGQDYLSAKELSGIPLYIISKLSIYVAFLFKRQKE
jgi:hypothetical protein